ncbi:hypothetical protein ACP4OV_003211 [Aristida adscensionis]
MDRALDVAVGSSVAADAAAGDAQDAASTVVPAAAAAPVARSGRRLRGRGLVSAPLIRRRLAALDAMILELELQDLSIRFGGGELGGGAEAFPAPATAPAVAGLEKRAFRAATGGDVGDGAAAATGCAVCLEDFEEGEEVSAMPCARGHEFHPACIAKWLGRSNTCPLCRHALPTSELKYL